MHRTSLALLAAAVASVFHGPVAVASTADDPLRFVDAATIAPDILEGTVDVIDARPFGDHLAGHVPGAVHLDDEILRGPRGGLPVQFHAPADTAAVLAAAGVSGDRPVLVHSDAEDPLAAALVAYALLRCGHEDVSILDGGWEAWAANHPTSRALPAPGPSAEVPPISGDGFAPSDPHMAVADFETVAHHAGWDEVLFVDARPARHYRGEIAAWPRSGHIPGAVSLDWTRLMETDNPHRIRDAANLTRIVHEEAGIPADAEVIVYCGTGREATLLALVLRHELGMEQVRLYEGSWTEYSASDLPAEVGRRGPVRTRIHRDPEGRVAISAQPNVDTLRWLADEGIATIVNLRSTFELENRMPYDTGTLAELGLTGVEIPLGWDDGYDPAAVDRLAEVMATTEGPVLLHCASGGRARTMYTAYLVRHEGVSLDAAMRRAAVLGGGPSSLERLLDERIEMRPSGRPIEAAGDA